MRDRRTYRAAVDSAGGCETYASYSKYRSDLVDRFWDYVQETGIPPRALELRREDNPHRPPVLVDSEWERNLILPPGNSRRDFLTALKGKPRHRWFRSMTSSQSLAWSVFGSLSALGRLSLLAGLIPGIRGGSTCDLEYDVDYLGERRHTSVDVMLRAGPGIRVAVECKLSESDIGTCSRPRLRSTDDTYADEYCDGSYCPQLRRRERCSLTEIEVHYWRHLANLTTWRTESNLAPCPLRRTYQLARNVMAASVEKNGESYLATGACVLLVDSRNPAFGVDGKGRRAFDCLGSSLRNPASLRMTTWQSVAGRLRTDGKLTWLVDGLRLKYGL